MVIWCDGVAQKWCNCENMQWFNDAFGLMVEKCCGAMVL